MIGRKITDQTITCKVIKPIPSSNVLNQIQKPNQNQSYSNRQVQAKPYHHHQYSNPQQQQCITKNEQLPNQGRVFGFSSQDIQVQFEFGIENAINYSNNSNKPQFSNSQNQEYNNINIKATTIIKQDRHHSNGSRNVTHFFINNKDKPINVQSKKTTINNNSMKNISQSNNQTKNSNKQSAASHGCQIQNSNKQSAASHGCQIHSTTAHSIKQIQLMKQSSNSININKNIINSNKSQLREKNISHNIRDNKIITKNRIPTKQKQISSQKHINSTKSPTNINKNNQLQQIFIKNSKQKTVQNQQQKPSSTTKNFYQNKKVESGRQKKQRLSIASKKQSLKRQSLTKQSVKRQSLTKQRSKHHGKDLHDKNQKKVQQRSIGAWQQSYEQPSVNIENFSQYESQKSEQIQQINSNRNQQHNSKNSFNKSQVINDNNKSQVVDTNRKQVVDTNNKKAIAVVGQNKNIKKTVPFKKYMSVKEQIQMELREKKQRSKRLQLQKRDKLNQLYIKKQKVRVQDQQQQQQQQEQEQQQQQQYVQQQQQQEMDEQLQQRRFIPQPIQLKVNEPIQLIEVDNFIKQKEQQKNNFIQKKKNNFCQKKQGLDEDNEFIQQVVTKDYQKGTNYNQADNQLLNYNYVQSSSDQQQQQQEQQQHQQQQQQQQQIDHLLQQSGNNMNDMNRGNMIYENLQKHQYNNRQPYEDQHYYEDCPIINKNTLQIYQQYQQPYRHSNQMDSQKQINIYFPNSQSQKQIIHQSSFFQQQQVQQYTQKQQQQRGKKSNTGIKTIDHTKANIINKNGNKISISKQSSSLQQQNESSEEQQQENNPKLLQYLKERNLISSSSKSNQDKQRTRSIATIKQTNNPKGNNNNSKQHNKMRQIINNYNINGETPQTIIQLDQQYLQSSIVVKQSYSRQSDTNQNNNQNNCNYNKDNDNILYPATVQFEHTHYNQQDNYNNNQQDNSSSMVYQNNDISSSDSEQYHPVTVHNPPPFINHSIISNQLISNSNSQLMDELFSLNLNSLLNKQFINLNP